MLARLTPVRDRVGITRVADVTGLDRIGVPVVAVCRPRNRSLAVHQGKGLTLAAARVSGIMESIERFCGEYFRGPDRMASYAELAADGETIEIGLWPVPSSAVRDADAKIGWTAGYDLMTESDVWVPYPVVHFDKRAPGPPGADSFHNTSTGLASGATYAEALLHALSEIVERDALTLWRLLPAFHQATTRVLLASVSDPACHGLIAAIEAAGLGCGIWNLTNEIEVPVFLCRIVEPRDDGFRPSDLVDGVGCHPCREIALSRAVTEAIQIRATAISGSRNDLFRRFYHTPDAAGIAAARASIAGTAAGRPFETSPTFAGDSPADDLGHLLSRLRPHVKHVIAVDVTHEETRGVPAVRVLVPELEDGEDMERYAPRRRAVAAYLGRP